MVDLDQVELEPRPRVNLAAPADACTARSAPVSANGSANTLWLKRTNER